MILLLLSTIIGVVSLQLFALNYSIQGLNRAILYTPIELMYLSVSAYSDEPHFDQEAFEHIVLDYYDSILPRYTDGFNVMFYYYNTLDHSMCIKPTCNAVEITVSCKLNVTYDYSRTMFYELREVNNG